jgi:TPR repeat protein
MHKKGSVSLYIIFHMMLCQNLSGTEGELFSEENRSTPLEKIPSYFYQPHNRKDSCLKNINANMKSYRDLILWAGAGFPPNFSSDTLSKEQEEEYERIGLASIENSARNGPPMYKTILAGYHYTFTKYYRKALYWAEQAAECGEIGGMQLLADAYTAGNGVVHNPIEALKWEILGGALGDPHAKEVLQNKRALAKESPRLKKEIDTAFNLATQWMHQHKSFFFSPQ